MPEARIRFGRRRARYPGRLCRRLQWPPLRVRERLGGAARRKTVHCGGPAPSFEGVGGRSPPPPGGRAGFHRAWFVSYYVQFGFVSPLAGGSFRVSTMTTRSFDGWVAGAEAVCDSSRATGGAGGRSSRVMTGVLLSGVRSTLTGATGTDSCGDLNPGMGTARFPSGYWCSDAGPSGDCGRSLRCWPPGAPPIRF